MKMPGANNHILWLMPRTRPAQPIACLFLSVNIMPQMNLYLHAILICIFYQKK
jgi:hypothetical protein